MNSPTESRPFLFRTFLTRGFMAGILALSSCAWEQSTDNLSLSGSGVPAPSRDTLAAKNKPDAYTGRLPYLAICYTRRDSDKVYPFIRKLQQQGYRVWYDEGIPLGSNWEDEVAARLAGAEQVLFFLSRNTLSSHWTRRELSFSLNKQKEILPLLLEKIDMPDGWAFLLGPTQFISLHELSPERQKEKMEEVLSTRAKSTRIPLTLRHP